jgi:hypothetical protein
MNPRSITTFLLLFSGICWVTVYIEAIRIGFRDKTYAIPFWAMALNLSWEVLHTILAFRLEGAALQVVINGIWALFDLVILYTWFRFGRRHFPRQVEKRWFIPWSILVISVAFSLQYAFVAEFGIYPGRAYAAFLQNLLMSILFIDMLLRRGSSDGQSMIIAVSKWLGTLAPTILFGVTGTDTFHGPNRMLFLIGLLCSLFDLIYIVILARTKANEKSAIDIMR